MPIHRTAQQLQLPVHGAFAEIDPASNWCQRWHHGRHSFTHRSAGGFRAELYRVEPLPEAEARAYVTTHHYAGTYPAARLRYGLWIDAPDGPDLLGVAVFGIPAQASVLTNRLPDLEPYTQSLELSRLVVEGDPLTPGKDGGRAPGNTETWFLARCMEHLAERGVRGVVAFADPVARIVGGRVLWPGHVGTIYQAFNAVYTGRATPRLLTVLPDGTSLSDRSLSKVRRQERGHEYVERRLVALGARPRPGGASNAAAWLLDALHDVGAARMRHGGCLSYVFATSRANRRALRIAGTALAYPKPHEHQHPPPRGAM